MNRPGRLDLADMTELLHEQAPRLREGELEAVKLRVLARAPKGPAMRSRLAITAALVAGMLMSLSGVALGISGISSSGSAGTAQYSQPSPQQNSGGNVPAPTSTTPTISTPPRNGESVPLAQVQVQAAKQSSSSPGGREIPFTGFLAIPVLLIGITLIGAGAILRRRVVRA